MPLVPRRWYARPNTCPMLFVHAQTRDGYSVARGLQLRRDGSFLMQTYTFRQCRAMVEVPRPEGGEAVEAHYDVNFAPPYGM